MKENRRRFLAEEKVRILRKHLVEKAPISDVCDEYGMTHVKTSPYYPQSNGKLERYHKTIKGACIRVHTPLSLADARTVVADFVDHYNTRRLHSAIGYVTPKDKLEGRAETILAQREAKLALARKTRRAKRKAS